MKNIEKNLVTPDTSIRNVVEIIDQTGVGIVLLVDNKKRLIGTITDGDVRRALIRNINLDASANELLKFRPVEYSQPIVGSIRIERSKIIQLMKTRNLRHLPLLDDEGCVVELALLSELVEPKLSIPLTAVIMAGGYGTRLRPLTENVPKPMLSAGGRPLLEQIVNQLSGNGIKKLYITTHYKPEIITNHFGDGSKFGVEIKYLHENEPLGTAGGLGMIKKRNGPLLIINGDILTQLDYQTLFEFHKEHRADMTVGVRKYEVQVPYGVIDTNGLDITQLIEKPLLKYFVNAGIYLLESSALDYIPEHKRFDMTDLIEHLIKDKRSVISFPIREYWLDIGQHTDYEQAQKDLHNGSIKIELE